MLIRLITLISFPGTFSGPSLTDSEDDDDSESEDEDEDSSLGDVDSVRDEDHGEEEETPYEPSVPQRPRMLTDSSEDR